MYENDFMMMNSRPLGANSIELKLMICMGVREFEFRATEDKTLDLKKFVLEYCSASFRPQDPKKFATILDIEIDSAIKMSLITPDGQLTPRGIYFVELNTQGAYVYYPKKFEFLFHNYITALQMPTDIYYYNKDKHNNEDIEEAIENVKEQLEETGLKAPTEEEEKPTKEALFRKIYKWKIKNKN